MKFNLRKKDQDVYNNDENNRGAFSEFHNEKPKRGSVFDTFVILLIVLAALLAYLYMNRNNDAAPPKSITVAYSLQVNNVQKEIKDCAKVGDLVRDGVTNSMIGKISYVEVFPFEDLVPDFATGSYVQAVIPDRYSVRMKITATGTTENGMVSIDGKNIAVGSYVPMQSADFAGEGYCVAMDVNG